MVQEQSICNVLSLYAFLAAVFSFLSQTVAKSSSICQFYVSFLPAELHLQRCSSHIHLITSRWERSRNTTITHVPHHSRVASMHLMPGTALLSASLHYGVVARSYALTGKVLRGFLDAAGTLNGMGVGNPNEEFEPGVTSVALAAEGGTARVGWGWRSGEVGVTIAGRAMDGNRVGGARLVRCRVEERHEGRVTCIVWGVKGDGGVVVLMTGGVDGRVKVWDAKGVECLWTSAPVSASAIANVPDPCVKVAVDVGRGAVVAAFRSGVVIVWAGFAETFAEAENMKPVSSPPKEIRISVPDDLLQIHTQAQVSSTLADREITELHVHSDGDGQLCILTAYKNSPFFHCHFVDLNGGIRRVVAFADGSNVPLGAVHPVFASSNPSETSFVITGDQLGWISIFALPTPVLSSSDTTTHDTLKVSPFKRFEAVEDGGITALAWNSIVLVSGSSRGSVKIFDSLTLAPIRAFSSPLGSRASVHEDEWGSVSQVLLESDAVVVSVGSRVMAWKAGPVGSGKDGKAVMGKTKKRSPNSGAVAKWHRKSNILLSLYGLAFLEC